MIILLENERYLQNLPLEGVIEFDFAYCERPTISNVEPSKILSRKELLETLMFDDHSGCVLFDVDIKKSVSIS